MCVNRLIKNGPGCPVGWNLTRWIMKLFGIYLQKVVSMVLSLTLLLMSLFQLLRKMMESVTLILKNCQVFILWYIFALYLLVFDNLNIILFIYKDITFSKCHIFFLFGTYFLCKLQKKHSYDVTFSVICIGFYILY